MSGWLTAMQAIIGPPGTVVPGSLMFYSVFFISGTLRCDFGQLLSLIANISGSNQDIKKSEKQVINYSPSHAVRKTW